MSWFSKTNNTKYHISKLVFDEFLTETKKEGSNYATLDLFYLSNSTKRCNSPSTNHISQRTLSWSTKVAIYNPS